MSNDKKERKEEEAGMEILFLFCHKQKEQIKRRRPRHHCGKNFFFSLFLLTALKPYIYRMNPFIFSSSSPFEYTFTKTHRNLCCSQALALIT
jgi:hypothetical protein